MGCSRKLMMSFSLLTIIWTAISSLPLGDTTSDSSTLPSINKITEGCSNDTIPHPNIVSRKEWGARDVTGLIPMDYTPAPYVVVHHGGIPHYCYDKKTCSTIVRSYQDLHIDVNGWLDIGYHFVIGEDGNVYKGRGWNITGSHAPGYNTQGIGISIIGDFTDFLPNDAALDALECLIEYGVSIGQIKGEYKLIGHRQARVTECPGTTFYDYLKTHPHWISDPEPVYSGNSNTRTGMKKKLPAAVDTVTGSDLWYELIALGEPRRSTDSTNTTAENAVVVEAMARKKCCKESASRMSLNH